MQPIFTKKEVADHLKVTEHVVRRLIETGELKHIRVGRYVRVRQDQIEEYEARDHEVNA